MLSARAQRTEVARSGVTRALDHRRRHGGRRVRGLAPSPRHPGPTPTSRCTRTGSPTSARRGTAAGWRSRPCGAHPAEV